MARLAGAARALLLSAASRPHIADVLTEETVIMTTRKSNGRGLAHSAHHEMTHLPKLTAENKRKAAVVGGVTLGTAAAATAIFLMRSSLAQMARSASALPSSILEPLGLQRRRSPIWTFGTPAGTLALGLAAGSLGAMWLLRGTSSDESGRHDAPHNHDRSATEPLGMSIAGHEGR